MWSQDGRGWGGDGIPVASLIGHLNQDLEVPEVQEGGRQHGALEVEV